MAQSRFGDRRVKALRQLGQAVCRVFQTQSHSLPQVARKCVLTLAVNQRLNRRDLPCRCIGSLHHVRGLTVDLPVDRVAQILLYLGLHQLHRRVRRTDAREEILRACTILEVQQIRAAAPCLLGR